MIDTDPSVDVRPILEKLHVDPKIPLPDLAKSPRIDQEGVAKWIAEEKDEARKAIKLRLLGSIEHITTGRFLDALATTAENVSQALMDKPYAVMLGNKPHASPYWTYSLAKNVLPPAAMATWFRRNATNMEALSQAFDEKGVDTFLFLDDVIYSGRQIYESVTHFLGALRQQRPDFKPTVIVAAPAATKRVGLIPRAKFPESKIVFVPPAIPLKTIEDTFSYEEKWFFKNQFFGRLNEGDEKRLPDDACLAFTDHRAPDHWTFPNPIARPTGIMNYSNHGAIIEVGAAVPYKDSSTEFFKEESEEYAEYQAKFETPV